MEQLRPGDALDESGLSTAGTGSQVDAAKFLKPDQEDKNVSPDQMVAFARSVGFNALQRVNGTPDLIKSLLRAGVPVLIEKGFEPEADLGWMGHYELIVGFNDRQAGIHRHGFLPGAVSSPCPTSSSTNTGGSSIARIW